MSKKRSKTIQSPEVKAALDAVKTEAKQNLIHLKEIFPGAKLEHAYEYLSKKAGFRDWNGYKAAIEAGKDLGLESPKLNSLDAAKIKTFDVLLNASIERAEDDTLVWHTFGTKKNSDETQGIIYWPKGDQAPKVLYWGNPEEINLSNIAEGLGVADDKVYHINKEDVYIYLYSDLTKGLFSDVERYKENLWNSNEEVSLWHLMTSAGISPDDAHFPLNEGNADILLQTIESHPGCALRYYNHILAANGQEQESSFYRHELRHDTMYVQFDKDDKNMELFITGGSYLEENYAGSWPLVEEALLPWTPVDEYSVGMKVGVLPDYSEDKSATGKVEKIDMDNNTLHVKLSSGDIMTDFADRFIHLKN